MCHVIQIFMYHVNKFPALRPIHTHSPRANMDIRKTPTKTWLKRLDLDHLSTILEENGFTCVGSLIAMDLEDLTKIFEWPNELKLGERRLIEHELKRLKQGSSCNSLQLNPEKHTTHTVSSAAVANRTKNDAAAAATFPTTKSTANKQIRTRKKLTYSKNDAFPISPLQSYILHQEMSIEKQDRKVRSLVKDQQEYEQERTPSAPLNRALTLCSKCHLREGHNRLNCPYPNPCTSAKYCCNIDKHPDEKQVLKLKNRQLSEEQKTLKSMKDELANRQRSSINIAQRYAVRVKETLIESDPQKYARNVGGKVIEDWRLINKDSKILEKHFKSKIPSPEEARITIETFDSNYKQQEANTARSGKTSVRNPYKMLWESRGVSWPAEPSSQYYQHESKHTSTRTDCAYKDDHIRSPLRKKAAYEEDDFQLAMGIQESLKTMNEFESENDEMSPSSTTESASSSSTSLDILAEAALRIEDER